MPPQLTPVSKARDFLLSDVQATSIVEQRSLLSSTNCVLAEDIVASINVPPSDNSAMDGYALRAADVTASVELPITQVIYAGHAGCALAPGAAARIFTGASIPENADTVVMQENCEEKDGQLQVNQSVSCGDNVRARGQDIKAGSLVFSQGTRLSARHIGLAASLGKAVLPVFKPLTAAVLSTGDELLEPGEAAGSDQIYNSNRYLLSALLERLGIHVIDAGIVPDNLEATKDCLSEISKNADIVISSGGVSVGDADFVKTVIESLGQLDFWKLAMKPGKPLAYGRIGSTPFFGLPGNPVSVFATFAVIVKPYLLRMQGIKGDVCPKAIPVRADFNWSKAGTREEYLRAKLVRDNDETVLTVFPNQSSGVLSSVVWADGFAVIPAGTTVAAGDIVDFMPFDGIL
ncbi:MAG: gephyrin-like molybdotransferase Glp [Pseudomonadales bacterium]